MKMFLALLTVLLLWTDAARADPYDRSDTRLPKDNEQAFIVEAIASGRDALVSGEYVLEGRMHPRDWKKAEEFRIRSVFDYSAGLSRLDSRFPGLTGEPPKVEQTESIIVHRPDLSLEWSAGPAGVPAISIFPPVYDPSPGLHRPLDIRAVGLETPAGWIDGLSTLKSMLNFYRENPLIAIEELNEGAIIRGDWLHVQGPNNPGNQLDVLYRVWLDTNLDYASIKCEVYLCMGEGTHDVKEIAPSPFASMDVGWERKAGAVVPVSVKAWEGGNSGKDTYEMAVTWNNVNGTVPKKAFEKEGLGLPGHTSVVDQRVEPALQLGRLDKRVFAQETDLFRERGAIRWGFIVVNALIILVIVAAMWYRRQKSMTA